MLPGILRTGTYSGSVARLNGTSVAAPLAARALADAIASGGSANTLKDKAAETLKEKRPTLDPSPGYVLKPGAPNPEKTLG